MGDLIELKPCPFCGAPAELEHGSDHHGEWFNLGCSKHWGRVQPENTCCAGRLWYTETDTPEADAIAAWNRRADAAFMEEVREVFGFVLDQFDELVNRHYGGDLPVTDEELVTLETARALLEKMEGK